MTGRTVYALLVGIDDYRPPVPRLRGCVADVEHIASLLRVRAAAAGDRAEIAVLTDAAATKDAVVDAFRTHLAQAGAADTALFYYSGHGSQEVARPEHLDLEPDGLNETLVLVDSRDPGRFDLVDKELAVLTGEVAAVAGHTLVVLDCCHSGSGVRAVLEDGTRERRAPTDTRERGLETYLGVEAWGSGAARSETTPAAGPADWLGTDPRGGYVLLAACQSHQTAKEVLADGVDRGAFSLALQRALAGIGGEPTYLDLQRWVGAAVRNLAVNQSPVLESPDPAAAAQPFLGGVAAPREPVVTAAFVAGRGWVLEAGRVHGLGPATAGSPDLVDLVPLTGGEVLVRARLVEVGVATAVLGIDDDAVLDRAATYRAVLTRVGQPAATVAVRGDGPAVERVRERLAGSSVVRPADAGADGGAADLEIVCGQERLAVLRPGSDRPVTEPEPAAGEHAVERVVAAAEHVGRWLSLAERANPATTLRAEEVTLSVLDAAGDPLPEIGGGVEVRYESVPEGETAPDPAIKVQVTNASRRRLHCAVLALSEQFGVACLTAGGTVLLQPGESTWLTDEEDRPQLRTFVPEDQERTTDLLKAIASTEPFDARSMEQLELTPPAPNRGPTVEGADRGVTRVSAAPASGPDWTTREVLVTTVRPGTWARVGREGAREIAPGIRVLGHPAVAAEVRLASLPSASRDALVPLLPPALLEMPTEPFVFSGSRSVGDEVSVLEIGNVVGREAVTRDDPLVIRVDQSLGEGELVVAFAADGEDYLPVGHARARGTGTDLVIDLLPEVTEAGTRSLGGSLKILFRKVVLRPLGLGYEHPLLSLVDYSGPEPRYVHDRATVASAVESAVAGSEAVLLLTHGILGDTRGMVRMAGEGPDPLAERYGAVLAFDYENVNTPVPETARLLAGRLADVGLGADRRIDVVAHSQGGLVARWWIENGGGAAAVRTLVTCGTPHHGSPWPRVQDVATAGLSLALNRFVPLVGPALAFLVGGFERVDDALDGMTPGSRVLQDLARSTQPDGVRYVLVAGDEPFGAGADAGAVARLLRKVRLPDAAFALLFGREPHDIAVSVPSATGAGAAWAVRPGVLDADCNHFGYFAAPSGIAAVRSALIP